jgi:hypothetical protein
LRAEIHRIRLARLRVGQALHTLHARLFRPFDDQLAFGRRAGERGRILIREAEINEIFRIIDFNVEPGRLHRLGEWQHEMQREHRVLEFEPVVDRISERELRCARGDNGEVIVFLERSHIDLGKRR